MQNLFLRFSFSMLVFVGLLMSCGEDGTIRVPEPEAAGPTLSLVAGADKISGDATIAAGSSFTVQISAEAGESALDVFTVKKNGTNVPFNQLTFDPTDIAANPVLILKESEQLKINYTIQITTDANSTFDTYSFEIKDKAGKTDTESINVTLESLSPTIRFVEEVPYFWSDKTCPANSKFIVRVLGEKGSADIQSLAVYEDGVLISDLARIQINGFDLFSNPTEVADDSKKDFDFEVTIETGADFGTKQYDIVVIDEIGKTATTGLNVTTGTSVTFLTGKLLLNQAGPVGTGGINLLTGQGVGSTAATAQIKDEGVNTDLANAVNWKQQISGANGSVVRMLGAGQPETFSYDNIQLAEQIIDLFETGTSLTLKNSKDVEITAKLKEGDILLIQNGENHFAVRVDMINISPADNADFYELSIKY